MSVSTSVRRVGTVSAAAVALVLSGGGLAFAATLPSDIGSTLTSTTTTVTSTTTGVLPTSDPLPLPTASPLPLPLPTASPTPSPTQSPTPTPTSAPAPAQTLLPALPGSGGSGSGGSGGAGTSGSGATGGTALAGGSTGRSATTSVGGHHAGTTTRNQTYPTSISGGATAWAMPALDLAPSFGLPAGAALVRGPGMGTQPLMAAAQPEVVQLAGASSAPQVAPPATPQDKRQAAGLVIVFAIVTIGGVAAGHASLLQQRLAHRAA